MNDKAKTPPPNGINKQQWKDRLSRLPTLVIISLILIPLILVAVYLLAQEFKDHTAVSLERRGTIADLSAVLIHEKFDGIIGIGTSLASRPLVYKNIEKGDWDGANKSLEGVLQAFPY